MSQQSPERVEQQASATTARVLALLAAWRAGQLSAPDMSRGAAVALYAGKLIASRLADIEVSTALNRPPVGIAPGDQHLDRLEEAVQTALDEDSEEEPDPEPRLERLATSEVLESHSRSLTAAIREQGIGQWREHVAEDACEICQPYRDLLHDAEETFTPHHPRCRCRPALPPQEAAEEPSGPAVRTTYAIA